MTGASFLFARPIADSRTLCSAMWNLNCRKRAFRFRFSSRMSFFAFSKYCFGFWGSQASGVCGFGTNQLTATLMFAVLLSTFLRSFAKSYESFTICLISSSVSEGSPTIK